MKRYSSVIFLLLCCVIQEFIAKAITLPGQGEIMDMMEVADPDAVHAVRTFIRKQLASELKEEFINTVCISSDTLFFFFLETAAEQLYILVYVSQVKNNKSSEQYQFDHPNSARRALKNTALGKPLLAFSYHLLWLNLSVFI